MGFLLDIRSLGTGDLIRSDGVSRQYFNYDRGWDVEPTDENAQLATEVLLHSENW